MNGDDIVARLTTRAVVWAWHLNINPFSEQGYPTKTKKVNSSFTYHSQICFFFNFLPLCPFCQKTHPNQSQQPPHADFETPQPHLQATRFLMMTDVFFDRGCLYVRIAYTIMSGKRIPVFFSAPLFYPFYLAQCLSIDGDCLYLGAATKIRKALLRDRGFLYKGVAFRKGGYPRRLGCCFEFWFVAPILYPLPKEFCCHLFLKLEVRGGGRRGTVGVFLFSDKAGHNLSQSCGLIHLTEPLLYSEHIGR